MRKNDANNKQIKTKIKQHFSVISSFMLLFFPKNNCPKHRIHFMGLFCFNQMQIRY